MKKKRYILIDAVVVLVFLIFATRLISLQAVKGGYYREKSDLRTTRSVELIAPRGELLDRYGRCIVKNRTGYSIYIQGRTKNNAQSLNTLINNLFSVMPSFDKDLTAILPVTFYDNEYSFTVSEKESRRWKKENNFSDKAAAREIVDKLYKRYDIQGFSDYEGLRIAAIRYDMSLRGFSVANAYLFREDAPIAELAQIKEQSENFPDICVVPQPIRDYPYGSLGAHILGRVGALNAQEYEKNKDNGYTMNSSIGKDGVEKYLEDYLRGENGRTSVERVGSSYSVSQKTETAPVAGKNVNLTIDLDMQLACEKALEETIEEIRSAAQNKSGGNGADAGSAVVIDVNTGDVLAMASYPTYDIKTFGSNYNKLLSDGSKPLFNRALAGTYSPASTFKILVGAAALEENIITPEDTILDTGKYTYFKDYQPACWIYNQSGGTHGYENVSRAIRDSCNVFFYETGRRLTIEKINKYAKKYGFGQKSGIELSAEEKTGAVASPENRTKSGGIWYPGDVCQTAIGQSDTLVTPLQLANYIATVANGGTRYRPHLIKSIDGGGKNAFSSQPEVLDTVKLKKENYDAVTNGIRMVVTEGTAFNAFLGCNTSVAAKTGSAQTAGGYTNGICVAYAPFDKPRIAIGCVIEKAGSGARTAAAIRKIVDAYFDGESAEKDIEYNSLLR